MFGPSSDRSEVRRYQSDKSKNYDMLFKIVLTGDCNAGKSRILQQFINGSSGQTEPTIGKQSPQLYQEVQVSSSQAK